MKKIDKDGLLLCELQAKAFEDSADCTDVSSEIFIRRFMNSNVACLMDNGDFLQMNIQAKDVIERIDEEYGYSQYGSVKYTKNELYWIGYIYTDIIHILTKCHLCRSIRLLNPRSLEDYSYHTIQWIRRKQ